ncbi:MAG: hypothetical protein JXB29_04035 [Sedimentisphaerales bacterium]|nr:hypothetical protein [Sedimentisphaerales bacterium]
MVGLNINHLTIVRDSLSGQRRIDDNTFTSLAVLADRLRRLKELDRNFEDINFSNDVEKLTRQKKSIAVC